MSSWIGGLPMRKSLGYLLIAIALLGLPFVAALGGQAWVRIIDFAILYHCCPVKRDVESL